MKEILPEKCGLRAVFLTFSEEDADFDRIGGYANRIGGCADRIRGYADRIRGYDDKKRRCD